MARIAVVEDDPTIRELVAAKLQRMGYEAYGFACAEEVVECDRTLDLYIIDVLLGGQMTGLDLCAHLRESSPLVPILILSALSEPTDRIDGLRSGADDYLGKPFEMEELLLRIRGMLKRSEWYRASSPTRFVWGECWVDFERFEARGPRGLQTLSQRECMLLKVLISKNGRVVTREEVLDQVWGKEAFPSTRTVDNFIVRLRKVFESRPGNPKYIHSVRGIGYKFTA